MEPLDKIPPVPSGCLLFDHAGSRLVRDPLLARGDDVSFCAPGFYAFLGCLLASADQERKGKRARFLDSSRVLPDPICDWWSFRASHRTDDHDPRFGSPCRLEVG